MSQPELFYLVGRVNHGVRRVLRDLLAPWDLGIAELTALSVLRARPGLSNAQLDRRCMTTPQTINEVVGRLAARGYLERVADDAHRKILRLSLTRAGLVVLAEIDPRLRAMQDAMAHGLTPAERAALQRGLQTMMRNLAEPHELD